MIFNLANVLTLSRIFFVIPITVLTLLGESYYIPALVIFVIAAMTDMFDGMAARKSNQVSDFGKIMDQVCDKILINSIFILFIAISKVPAWFVVILVARDTCVNGMRTLLAGKKIVVAADKLGKLKTVLEIALIICVYSQLFGNIVESTLMYMTLIISVVSGLNYIIKNLKHI